MHDHLICPSSGDTTADTMTSYQFVDPSNPPPTISGNGDSSLVVMYEPCENHGGEGANVLFADGHVEFISPCEEVERLVEETRHKLAQPADAVDNDQ